MMLFARRKRRIRRLLLVEDEPLVAFDSEYSLTAAGFEVVATVDSGEAAMGWLSPDQVDVALLDLSIAGELSGIDLARLAAERGVPVLFVTGSDPGDARSLAWGHLAKPYLPHQLVAAIDALDAISDGRAPRDVPPGMTLFREAPAG